MSRKTKYLLIAAACLVATFPMWAPAIAPQMFSKVACVIQQPDGTPVKAWGEAACINNGMSTVVLSVK